MAFVECLGVSRKTRWSPPMEGDLRQEPGIAWRGGTYTWPFQERASELHGRLNPLLVDMTLEAGTPGAIRQPLPT